MSRRWKLWCVCACATAAVAMMTAGELRGQAGTSDVRPEGTARAGLPMPSTAPAPVAATQEPKNPTEWKPQTKSVAVFKNGMGFFVRRGEVTLRDGWCVSGEVPPAAFGTLAIFSQSPDQTVDIVGSGQGEVVEFDGADQPADVAAKRARLAASLELNVQLTYKADGGDKTAAGKLKSADGKYAVLEAAANTFAVPIEQVKKMQLLDLPIRVHVQDKDKKAADKADLGMAYLRKGITWVPEYTLSVLGDDEAELLLRGTLVNEAEDLIHADVNFVVGVPHFAHADYPEPIAAGQMIRTIGVATGAIPSQVMSQIANVSRNMVTQAPAAETGIRRVEDAGGSASLNLPQMEGGGAASDYTVYTKKDLTVRRGEKAVVTLFRHKIRYTHVYRWTVPGTMEHMLSLQNATDTAWTTGPCLAVSHEQPLGEDLLKYTAKNSLGEFPVTEAINVYREVKESETDRKPKAAEPSNGYFLDLVTVKGDVTIKNFEKRPITVYVTAPINGKPIQASHEGRLVVDTNKLRLVERAGSVSWTIKLDAGETKTVSYTYERYVPSN